MLDSLLAEIPGITAQTHDARVTRNGHYAYIFHFDSAAFSGITRDTFVSVLEAEGIPLQAPYPPLHKLDVFSSGAYKERLSGEQANESHYFLNHAFPNSIRESEETVWIKQNALLGDEADMHETATAIQKIYENALDLVKN